MARSLFVCVVYEGHKTQYDESCEMALRGDWAYEIPRTTSLLVPFSCRQIFVPLYSSYQCLTSSSNFIEANSCACARHLNLNFSIIKSITFIPCFALSPLSLLLPQFNMKNPQKLAGRGRKSEDKEDCIADKRGGDCR